MSEYYKEWYQLTYNRISCPGKKLVAWTTRQAWIKVGQWKLLNNWQKQKKNL